MTWAEWANLTYEELAQRRDSVAVLPIGALEAHGPHLPLGTDLVIGEAMARAAAHRLGTEGVPCVLLPALGYTVAGFAAAFAGTISVSPDTCRALVLDIAREVHRHGLRALAIANAHLDPQHLEAVAAATAGARQETGMPVIFPNLARRALAARLTEEFRSGACHAGRFEGSVVLEVRPDLVRDELRQGLPPNPRSLSDAIRAGKTSFESAGGPRAYFGWPADATAEEGRATIAVLGDLLAEAVLAEVRQGGKT